MPTTPDAHSLAAVPPAPQRRSFSFGALKGRGGALAKGAVLAAALVLAGCQADEVGYGGGGAKANRPIAPATLAKMRELNMSAASPILIRLFKQESELEVWKKGPDGKFALLNTYEICKWSGDLGPKVKEGDRQAPEGFYMITPGLMNPNSSYHLAFNLGFPNAYDRSHGRTGSHLMVHGACSSRGCYAMEDKQIQDIYALGREAFRGGQRSFQVQAFPFKMTPENLAKHEGNPNMPFWQMLKEGYDHFEVTRLEPKVDVCGRQYVFNAKSADPNRGLDPSRACPILDVPQEISIAVASKKQKDEEAVRQIVAAMKAKQQKMDENKARDLMIASAIEKTKDKGPVPLAPGAAPAAGEEPDEATRIMIASGVPLPIAAPGRVPSATAVASAKPEGVGGFFGSMFSFAGGGSSDAAAAANAGSAPPVAVSTVASAGAPTADMAAVQVAPAAAPSLAAPADAAPAAAAPADAAAAPVVLTETAAAPPAENGNFLSKAFGSLFGG
ncbi:murein L,D-transpeptidase family protein [Pseudoxanthobacter sp. M-2]|uniref:transcriptional regulator n=1 Tax=Pseudoxanthobacter sp. M-2 TaxID=3078754 RepID=UPI0038FC39C6